MRKIFFLVLFAIFAVPLSSAIPLRGTDVWYVQYITLFSIFFLGISLVLWQFNRYLSVFTMLCLFSVIFVTGQDFRSIFYLLQLDLACLGAYAVSKLNSKQRRWLLRAVVGVVIIQGVWVIVQSLNIDPIFNATFDALKDDTVGFSGSHNQIGVFFAVTSPVVLVVCPWVLPLTIFGLWKSTTSFAWIGFIVASLIVGRTFNKKVALGIAIALILVSAVFWTKFDRIGRGHISNRVDPAKRAIVSVLSGEIAIHKDKPRTVKCNPWFGFGLGNFTRIFPFYQTDKASFNSVNAGYFTHAHNDYVEMFFELGKTGLIVFLLWLLNLLWRFATIRKSKELWLYFSCLSAYMICALGLFATHVAVSGMWLILFYGLLEGKLREQNGQTSSLG